MLGRYIFHGNVPDSIQSSLAKVSSIVWEMSSLPPLTDSNFQERLRRMPSYKLEQGGSFYRRFLIFQKKKIKLV